MLLGTHTHHTQCATSDRQDKSTEQPDLLRRQDRTLHRTPQRGSADWSSEHSPTGHSLVLLWKGFLKSQ